jgi:hypothetical protein
VQYCELSATDELRAGLWQSYSSLHNKEMVPLNNITSLHNNCVHQSQRRSTRNSHVFIFLKKPRRKTTLKIVLHIQNFSDVTTHNNQLIKGMVRGDIFKHYNCWLICLVPMRDVVEYYCSWRITFAVMQLQINIQMRNKCLVLRLIPMILLHLHQKSWNLLTTLSKLRGQVV